MVMRIFSAFVVALTLALAACGDGGGERGAPSPAETGTSPALTQENRTPSPTAGATPVTPSITASEGPGGGAQDGASSDLPPGVEDTPLNRARQLLAQQFNARFEDVQILSIAAQAWPDACLGLPKRNETCAQVVTPGFRIVLVLGDSRYTYRTDELGRNIRLEKAEDFSDVGDDEGER